MRILWVSTLCHISNAGHYLPAIGFIKVHKELIITNNSRAATAGMCSKCYKEKVKPQEMASASAAAEQKLTESSIAASQVPAPAPAASAVSDPVQSSSPSKPQVDRSRCAECKKKVGLTGIECRCGQVYCGAHRMAEKHACTFDFKSFGRTNIEKANEKVVAQSLEDKL